MGFQYAGVLVEIDTADLCEAVDVQSGDHSSGQRSRVHRVRDPVEPRELAWRAALGAAYAVGCLAVTGVGSFLIAP
ncbi:hypothetical protein ACFVRD_47905 [Streptomyces sp. NPDC057908]|uniref:hypothetical protein n=1 Tax=Streptomyces sp. NPDC057908 TaxID=3346276 RepID=UPI0036E61A70